MSCEWTAGLVVRGGHAERGSAPGRGRCNDDGTGGRAGRQGERPRLSSSSHADARHRRDASKLAHRRAKKRARRDESFCADPYAHWRAEANARRALYREALWGHLSRPCQGVAALCMPMGAGGRQAAPWILAPLLHFESREAGYTASMPRYNTDTCAVPCARLRPSLLSL